MATAPSPQTLPAQGSSQPLPAWQTEQLVAWEAAEVLVTQERGWGLWDWAAPAQGNLAAGPSWWNLITGDADPGQ